MQGIVIRIGEPMPSYAEGRRRADDHALIQDFTHAVVGIFAVLDLPITPEQVAVVPYDECRLVTVSVTAAALPVSVLFDDATFRDPDGANFYKRVCDLAGKVREVLRKG